MSAGPKDYDFNLEYFPLDKGLGCLTPLNAKMSRLSRLEVANAELVGSSERFLGLDFSIPEHPVGYTTVHDLLKKK